MPSDIPIPSKLPDGTRNPAYAKAYRAKRLAMGIDDQKSYRQSPKGKEAASKYAKSEKVKVVKAKYRKTIAYKNSRIKQETAEGYAARIMQDLEFREQEDFDDDL